MTARTLHERTAALPSSAYFMTDEGRDIVKARAQQIKDELAAKRAKVAPLIDLRKSERRAIADRRSTGAVEGRRIAERRQYATMDDKLAAVAHAHDRFSGAAIPALADWGAW